MKKQGTKNKYVRENNHHTSAWKGVVKMAGLVENNIHGIMRCLNVNVCSSARLVWIGPVATA